MPELKVKISTEAEMSEAKALEGQLEKTIFRAKALGKEFGETERQLAELRAGMRDYKDANEDTEKKSFSFKESLQKMGMSFTDLRKGLKDLKHEVPGLGIVLMALKNPIVGLIAITGLAIAGIIQHFKKLKEEADKLAQEIRESTDRQAKAWEDVRLGAFKYKVELDDIGKKAQGAADRLADMNEQLDSKKHHSLERLKAQKELALAEVEASNLSEVEKTKRKLAIKKQYEADVMRVENDATQGKILNERVALQQAQNERAKNEKRFDQVTEQLSYAKGVEGRREKETEKKRAEMDATKKKLDHSKENFVDDPKNPHASMQRQFIAIAQDEYDKKKKAYDDSVARDKLVKESIIKLEHDKKRAESALTKSDATVEDLERKIPKDIRKAGEEMGNRRELLNLNQRTEDLRGKAEIKKIEEENKQKAEKQREKEEREAEREEKRKRREMQKYGGLIWSGKDDGEQMNTEGIEGNLSSAAGHIENIVGSFNDRLNQLASRVDANRGGGEA